MKGELSALPGEKPLLSDWIDHLSTAFPEVRLKSFLEMRGADGGPWSRICALPACGLASSTISPRSTPPGTK
jgi:glutamate--cysteine ligase